MFNLRTRSLTQQISAATIATIAIILLILTTATTWVAKRSAVESSQSELGNQIKTMQVVLDSYFENVKSRSERQFKILNELMPGELSLGDQLVTVNGVSMPAVTMGGRVINGDHKFLEELKTITDNEAAIIVIHDGKVLRASTLLKKDGKFLDGSEIPATDPVAKQLLSGQDYAGLTVRNGSYFFSKVRVLKDANGKPYGGLSLRLNLQSELNQISNMFKSLKIAKTGYVSIIRVGDEKVGGSEFVLHPTLAGKSLNDLKTQPEIANNLRSISTGPLGVSTMDGYLGGMDVNANALLAVGKSDAWQWRVVAGAPMSEFLEQSNLTRNLNMLAGLIAAVICTLVVSWTLSHKLKPLTHVAQALKRLGSGDLNAHVEKVQANSRNEIDVLGSALNNTAEQMKQLIGGVDQASREIQEAANNLLEQVEVARQCSEQQFDASSSMSASVEQMHAAVSQVAENATEAAQASANVSEETNRGRDMVSGTIADMNTISQQVNSSAEVVQTLGESSQQILNIVSVIRDIAEKTNLLALNAAIEAARAGEAGRGFAVVADEVRKLAEMTRQSTQEISSTVGNIVGQTQTAVTFMESVSTGVGESVERANNAGSALDEIDQLIERSAVRANDIAHSTSEQRIATERLAQAVEKITDLAHRNHTATQNSEESARQMMGLAHRLKDALSQFKAA